MPFNILSVKVFSLFSLSTVLYLVFSCNCILIVLYCQCVILCMFVLGSILVQDMPLAVGATLSYLPYAYT